MFSVYILHSQCRECYYVGYTSQSIEHRIKKHNTNHNGFTGKVKDWKLVYTEQYDTKAEAMKREKEIKARKSKNYIAQLVQSNPAL